MSTPRALARRYARALLDVAGARGADPDPVLALRDELRAFAPILAGHPELSAALQHPGVGAGQKQRVLAALAERAGATDILRRLLDLLAARDRIGILPDVVEAYAGLANAARGVVSADVVSAAPLPEEQKRALGAALRDGGTAVELRERVEPDVVGGLLVRSGGRTYDGTVRTRLASLRRRLSGPGPSSGSS